MDLTKKILSDPVNKWIFSYAKSDIFLVGGYIRDLLLDGHINKDKDYILKGNIRDIALTSAKKFKGTFIELKKDQTCRVALRDGQFIDFSYIRNTLSEDLSKRDFTINAIAWSPEQGIIDLFNGEADLKQKKIRVVNPVNLADDPLRVLRAYRIAAQLGFDYNEDTRNHLRTYSSGLSRVAPERITQELFKLLITRNATHYLNICAEHNVLHRILGLTTGNIKLNLATLGRFDHFLLNLRNNKNKNFLNYRIFPILEHDISQGLNSLGLIKLSILLNKLDRTQVHGSEKLKYSNSVKKRLRMIHNGMKLNEGRLTNGRLYNIFAVSGDCIYEMALIVSVTRPKNVDKYLKRAYDFIRFKAEPFLDGYEVQRLLNSGPSAIIGQIEAEIQRQRFIGNIRRKEDALKWITSNFT